MSRFLVSDDNPEGYKLEAILTALRNEVIFRCTRIAEDHRDEAQHVLANNTKILGLMNEAIDLATDSSRMLDKSFGPSTAAKGGAPRIGV